MKTFKTILWWIGQFTWGLPTTLVGSVLALYALIRGVKPQKFGYTYYFVFGKRWGGASLGGFFFLSEEYKDSLFVRQHESGHQIQNLIFGVFFPFVVGIPSAVRHHVSKRKYRSNPESVGLVISLILLAAGTIPFMTGAATRITTLFAIGAFLIAYSLGISIWIFVSVIPQIRQGKFEYYKIWFEAKASEWGENMYVRSVEK